jgi:ATP-dependent endonuclease of the OLD family-like
LEEVAYEQISDNSIDSLEELHSQGFYTSLDTTSSEVSEEIKKKNKSIKSQITNNFNLLKKAGKENIHFNIPKLEVLLGYNSNDKDPIKIYQKIKSSDFQISGNLFPKSLASFLGLNEIDTENNESVAQENDDLPF